MNLYLVLALALGAATPGPVAPPTMTIVATRCVCSQRAVPFAVRRLPLAVVRQRPTANGERPTANETLTGAATPRAPARS